MKVLSLIVNFAASCLIIFQLSVLPAFANNQTLFDSVEKAKLILEKAEKDIDDIQISTRRITSRGGKITQIDVDDDSAPGDTPELPV